MQADFFIEINFPNPIFAKITKKILTSIKKYAIIIVYL